MSIDKIILKAFNEAIAENKTKVKEQGNEQD